MATLQLNSDPEVKTVFDNYPDDARKKMSALRALILETAEEMEEVSQLKETLKWNEPSYITKIGSTLRIDWKAKQPEQYAMYFSCSSRLVSTFKMLYNQTFSFEGNRAIVFQMDDTAPYPAELKNCIIAALRYHKVKQLPTLGI
ncbi:DUF1801 domain-containing protein [Poritiphilus flavus]|uniref:DUF1801 domain-containing protein n=1 Tax=Poritiphilus flavus TaxID=2697053 RepID=A0A6L9EFX9_9FLAO|nr:DUF1801 domain-containing protein [Poritiphilus flavus]NAS13573.1 DUF1801 domain-containing protein [Poritiphilus flavus]